MHKFQSFSITYISSEYHLFFTGFGRIGDIGISKKEWKFLRIFFIYRKLFIGPHAECFVRTHYATNIVLFFENILPMTMMTKPMDLMKAGCLMMRRQGIHLRAQPTAPAYRGEKHIRDDQVGKWLDSLSRKVGASGSILVCIDACHSGTATRSQQLGVVRGDPSP
jgi:hypothetical protein